MAFRAPVSDIAFALKYGAGFTSDELTGDDVDAVLTEAGRFASDVIAPLNALGDGGQGARGREPVAGEQPPVADRRPHRALQRRPALAARRQLDVQVARTGRINRVLNRLCPLARLQRTVDAMAEFHSATMSIITVDGEPGEGPDLHRHPYEEVFVIVEGEARSRSATRRVVARARRRR